MTAATDASAEIAALSATELARHIASGALDVSL
ncbi:MAG: hypothetical protein QOF02_453 [Blastocatellia bacterium]|jgi:hypothetical protein|nr:hypothetical protein [Blastocatellia bacterium]